MNKLIFVEGLWHTGKSYFIESVNLKKRASDKVIVADNLRNLGSIRHAAYSLYPKVLKTHNILFDRSPVTMKVIANSSFYKQDYIDKKYWDSYYKEWISVINELDYKIIFIYFRPFYENTNTVREDILHYIKNYAKTELRIKTDNICLSDLTTIHEMFTSTINSLYQEFKDKFTYYQVEYRNTSEAMDILLYEEFMASLSKDTDESK